MYHSTKNFDWQEKPFYILEISESANHSYCTLVSLIFSLKDTGLNLHDDNFDACIKVHLT